MRAVPASLTLSEVERDEEEELNEDEDSDELLNRKKAILCKCVYNRKEGIIGVQEAKFKARLLAKAYSQVQGIDIMVVFSPIVRYSSIWHYKALWLGDIGCMDSVIILDKRRSLFGFVFTLGRHLAKGLVWRNMFGCAKYHYHLERKVSDLYNRFLSVLFSL
ncbi:Reverse transcriptase, RNA-dependent DNA polymerase [Dillenia turbinata]|uniref:Reverse transcriptase, RNA-dependent DNA polymerase n=1 Tax=Dillenia turbinata TaxID=194707 RepID=A0AAN8ZDT8_9MAGN